LLFTLIYKDFPKPFFNSTQRYVSENEEGSFIFLVLIFINIYPLHRCFSKYGMLRIEGKTAKPEFKKLS
jgi:choline/glycine/proline betaine transport protein